MAEEKQKKRGGQTKASSRGNGRKRSSTSGDGRKRSSSGRNGRPNAATVAGAARRAIAELMGRDPEAVSGVQRGDDDGWLVTIEFVELERIPQSTDVMATYEVELDDGGELTGYRRTRRYVRSQAEG